MLRMAACALLLTGSNVLACSCPMGPVEAAFDAAPNVFIAHVTRVSEVPPPKRPDGDVQWEDMLVQHAEFTALETFKGDPKRVRTLRSGYGHGDCGVPLIVGMDYLVLVGDEGVVSYCSGFFGPHYGWLDRSLFRSDRRVALERFTASVRDHFRAGKKIAPAPRADLGIEDDASLWFTSASKRANDVDAESGCGK